MSAADEAREVEVAAADGLEQRAWNESQIADAEWIRSRADGVAGGREA